MGLDKVSTQIKTDIYFKKHAEEMRAKVIHDAIKYWDENCSSTVP